MLVLKETSYVFSKNNKPTGYANPGDIVKFITKDCYDGQLTEDSDLPNHPNYDHTNPATGPLYINGAEPGDALAVDILNIDVADHGVTVISEECGPLWPTSSNRTRILKVDENGYTAYKDVKIKIDTMIGVIGTAPDGDDIPTGWCFDCGGNMDSKIIRKGATLWLPVRVPGALLSMGDLHATMGDGEVVGTGLEIDGEVLVRVRLLKNFKLNWTVTETKDEWYVNTNAPTCDEAISLGYKEMQRLIAQAYDWDLSDASMYMTLCGNLSANQACIEEYAGGNTFRIGTPKLPNKRGLIFGEVLK